MPRFVPSAFNLESPIRDQLVIPDSGMCTQQAEQYFTNLSQVLRQISGIKVGVAGSDATDAIQQGISQAIKQGGGVVELPVGEFTIGSVNIPAGSPPVWITGQGPATILRGIGNLPNGVGRFNISSNYAWLTDFVIDGGRTVPVAMRYGADFSTPINASDPMADSLTNGTSVWVHGAVRGFVLQRMRFQHAAGYSVLLDATSGDISDVEITGCHVVNNRPTLFGTAPAALIYGSWNGGIFAKADGRAASGAQSGVISNLLVSGCRFERNNGNCLWSHVYGFARFNSNFRYIGNSFLDCGLDAILVTAVSGGAVEGNSFRRIGYTTQTDDDQSYPRYLPGLNATAIDSGVVKGVVYTGNAMISVNGGCIDLDTHGQGSVTGNVCRIPYADEPEYIEDQIALTGSTNTGSESYGLNMGCNYPVVEGAQNTDITGNTLLNLKLGAIRLFSARFCNVQGNLIDVPANASFPPIALGPQSLLAYQRCYNNRISHNHFQYSPAAPATPAIKEDETFTAFTGGEKNYIFGNNPIIGNGNAIEFQKSPTSGSTVYASTVWFP